MSDEHEERSCFEDGIKWKSPAANLATGLFTLGGIDVGRLG